jgi:hypothetical protein
MSMLFFRYSRLYFFELVLLSFALLCGPVVAQSASIHYTVEFIPQAKTARVEITLENARWLKQARFKLHKHQLMDVQATGEWKIQGDEALWRPATEKNARLSYTIKIPHERHPGEYDAFISPDWTLLRGEDLVPPVAVRKLKNADVAADVNFILPKKWTSVNTGWYRTEKRANTFVLKPGNKAFARPDGWVIAGILGTRHEQMFRTQVSVSAPRGHDFRQTELMTFLSMVWPHIDNVFQNMPEKILIAGASDPMWRGGLSSPTSLYLHSDRPLVSENGTSTLIHELIHVITGIHGVKDQDWIAEGLAEFYAVEVIFRAGGFSSRRREKIFTDLSDWGKDVKSLRQKRANGPVTARAAAFFDELDRDIQKKSSGRYKLDHLLQRVIEKKYVGVADLQKHYKLLIGMESPLLASALVR